MPKKVKTIIKLNLTAGEATPAPPVGPALGQHGLPIMDFIKAYNAQTEAKKGQIIPVVITVYEDNTFSFVTKLPPVSELIKKEIKLEKGSGETGKKQVGLLTEAQITKIAKEKMADLNTENLEAAKRIVQGTAKSMGIKIKE
ncbi:50S ribosomal protein L11 [Microgenomates group bacterium RBG_19FT_COMBO_39_10]|nr:MAG: 50S ribosomal protein L11 [Microgenomates group bacterium RBG_19FT_COMBO_39_10]